MEYTDMIEKIKALAIKNREAKTAEEKALIKEQMERLKAEDEKLCCSCRLHGKKDKARYRRTTYMTFIICR